MPSIVTPRQLDQRAELYYQLGMMTAAGITLLQALESLRKNPPARLFSAPLGELILHLEAGSTFTDAMRRLGQWLPAFDVALLNAGEHSGRLDQCFKLLAGYYQGRAQLIRQTISGLLYPVGLLHFAVLLFPLGMLQRLVLDGAVLAFVAQKLLVLGPLYALAGFLIFASQDKRNEQWREMLEQVMHRIPLLGSALRALALARLAASLEALLSAGVTQIEAWNLAAEASGSPALRRAVARWQPQFAAQRTPAEVMRESPEFPELFANLYHSGEVSGQIDTTLLRLHRHYQEEGERNFALLAAWFPRLIYGLVVIAIVWMIFDFYTGYFRQIGDAIAP
jgi:type IV pilus assembly protein PilC